MNLKKYFFFSYSMKLKHYLRIQFKKDFNRQILELKILVPGSQSMTVSVTGCGLDSLSRKWIHIFLIHNFNKQMTTHSQGTLHSGWVYLFELKPEITPLSHPGTAVNAKNVTTVKKLIVITCLIIDKLQYCFIIGSAKSIPANWKKTSQKYSVYFRHSTGNDVGIWRKMGNEMSLGSLCQHINNKL